MKAELREQGRKARANISNREEKNSSIAGHLKNIPEVGNAQSIMFYMPTDNEVDITGFVESLNVDMLLPYVSDGIMYAGKISDLTDTESGAFNILEPKTKRSVVTFDVVLVPGISFDSKGNRIGFGKAFYDTFLKDKKTTIIGVAYQAQIVTGITPGKYDIPMHMVVTEEGRL